MLEHTSAETAQGNTYTGQQQNRLTSDSITDRADPLNNGTTKGGGTLINSLKLLQDTHILSQQAILGAGRQQALEHTNAQATQGDSHTSKQQDRLARKGLRHSTDPANDGGEHSTDGGQQRADSDSSNLSRSATLLSLVISK